MAAPGRDPADQPDDVAVHPIVAADSATGRAAARLGVEYVLRTTQVFTRIGGGDIVTGIVLYAVLVGNVGHFDQDPNNPDQYRSVDDRPPDEARRPVSVLGVANSLGLPYETARRHANKLVRMGLCTRVKGGLIGRAASLQGPEEDADILTNAANLRRLYRGLRRAGFNPD